MKDKKDIKYIIYARKSTDAEDKQMQSVESQVDYLKQKAKEEGLNVVMILREKRSAKKPGLRPVFDHAMELIENGEADGFLSWHTNRLSRNPAESGMIQQALQDEKIKSVKTSNREFLPEDNAIIWSVEAGMSNEFIRELRKNVKRGLSDKIKAGGLIGPAPEGYLNDKLNKKVYKDPVRFKLIRSAFDMYLAGQSVQEIRRYLNEDCGYRTVKRRKVGGKPLSINALYYILSNMRYAGKIPHPYTGEIFEAKYTAMITEEEYNQVQLLLGSKGKPRLIGSKSFALRGLMRCGECNCQITAEEHTKKLSDGTSKKYIYYRCTGKKPCGQKSSVREELLFVKLENLLSQYEVSPQLYEWGLEAIADIAKKETKKQASIQGMQTLSIEEVQTQLNNLLDLATKGFIPAEEYAERSKPLRDELLRLQVEYNDALTLARNWYDALSSTLNTLNGAKEKFANGDLNTKKQILLAIGSNPTLKDGELSINTYEWLTPIKYQSETLTNELEKVRNASQQIRNTVNQAVITEWYPGLGSNQRP